MITIDVQNQAEANRRIRELGKALDDKTLKKVFRKNTKPLIAAARALTPKADRTVNRYSTSKVTSKLRAPKGSGKVIARYAPGNLAKSIGNIPIRRAKRTVLVGPRAGKKRKYDGYYGHFLEFGTVGQDKQPYMGPGWKKTQGVVLGGITKDIQSIIYSKAV